MGFECSNFLLECFCSLKDTLMDSQQRILKVKDFSHRWTQYKTIFQVVRWSTAVVENTCWWSI